LRRFSVAVTKTMKAYSDVFLGNDKDLSGGDKIILHASVLEDLSTFYLVRPTISINDCHFNRNRHSLDLFHFFVFLPSVDSLGDGDLPHPTIFQIENFKSYRMSHCGVLEYSAHDRAAYLPKWVWRVMSNQSRNIGGLF
jgi:hypothetical protein